MTTFLSPISSRDTRAVQLGQWQGNPIFGTWVQQSAYYATSGTTLNLSAVSGTATPGFVSTAYWSSGTWFLGPSGFFVEYTSGGTVTSAFASGAVPYIGLAAAPKDTTTYLIDASGKVYSHVSGTTTFTAVSAFASGQAPPTPPVIVSGGVGAVLYTLLGATSGLGSMTVGSGAVTSGFVATPIPSPEVLASSGSGLVAVGGWSNAQIASGFNAISFHPTLPTLFAATVSAAATSGLQTWTDAASGTGTFSQTQAVTSGLGLNALAWTANGNQLLVGQAASGINVYSFAASSLTFSGAVPAGASPTNAIAITPDNVNALTAQASANTLTPLTVSGGTQWISGATLALNNPQAVLLTSSTTIAVGYTSGYANYSLSAGSWSQSSHVNLTFPASYLALDYQSNVIAAGTSGASGFLATSGASVSFTGSVSGLVVVQQQFALYDGVGGNIRTYSLTPAGSALVAQTTTSNNNRNMMVFGDELLLLSSISAVNTNIRYFSAPYKTNAVASGMVSLYNGAAFTTTNLGTGFRPTAMSFDVSGNISVATQNNWLVTVASGGGIASSGQITQQVGQLQTVPLGIAGLQWNGGHLYACSSLNDALLVLV